MRNGRWGAAIGLALLLCAAAPVPAAGQARVPVPPSPSRWVTDEAGFISPGVADALNSRLRDFEARTGRQVIVYIGRTTGAVPLEDFAVRAFQAWKVGRKGLDDGLVLFIMADDRRVRIEVGYGLEGVVPDITAGRIINDVLVPKIREGDADGGVEAAVTAILAAITGEGAPAESGQASRRGKEREIPPVFLIIAGIVFLIIFITNPSFALWLLFSLLSGGRGGGIGGGGGGGFRGGGGRSGGGGASGGW